MVQVHRIAQAVDGEIRKGPRHHAFQQTQISFPSGFARGRRARVTIRHQLQRLRFALAEASRFDAQDILAPIETCHSADEVALLRPQMQHAPPMLGGKSITRRQHFEEHAAIFQHRRPRMLSQKCLERAGQFRR